MPDLSATCASTSGTSRPSRPRDRPQTSSWSGTSRSAPASATCPPMITISGSNTCSTPAMRRAQPLDGPRHNRQRHRIALTRRLKDGPAGDQLRLLTEQPRRHRGAAAVHCRPRLPFDRPRREHRLQASAIAAHAQGTVGVHGDVSQMSRQPRVPAQQVAVGHHGAAHAHSQRQHHHVVVSARRAPGHLARHGHARVVIRKHRHVQRQAHQVAQPEPSR